ncbi:putative FBD-associated F-box protein At5g50270 isoform X2 [Triticum urartu]|nr:putative FBD-associated F-box protein At5g50270 isoform X2 [Triticum urartu]
MDPAPGGPADLISVLPEDLLLEILERLGSARAAAVTSLLSRRWRGLWTRLPSLTLSLHDLPFGSIEAALHRAAARRRPGVYIYHLNIRVAGEAGTIGAGRFSSLLWDAARLSPVELRLSLPRNLQVSCLEVTLPSFHRATSMDLRARELHLTVWAKPYGPINGCYVPFRSLERLSLSGCHIDLATFIPFCPRLRVLRLNTTGLIDMSNITVHSASLEELVVEHGNRWTGRTHISVSVDSPVLKQLTASFHACGNIGVSILAPMLDKVWWRCSYAKPIYGLGLWGLSEVGFNTDAGRDACVQLPSVHVLSLHISAVQVYMSHILLLQFSAIAGETELIQDVLSNCCLLLQNSVSFPNAELSTKGHVFGAFVLGMHLIRTALRNLKIVLLRSEVKDACPVNCPCDEPKNWRTETITLADLENMEIEGIGGEDHEFDFLKVIFRCAPMLKTVTVRLSDGVTPSVDWCTKVNNMFMAYPSVECNADLVSRAKAVC